MMNNDMGRRAMTPQIRRVLSTAALAATFALPTAGPAVAAPGWLSTPVPVGPGSSEAAVELLFSHKAVTAPDGTLTVTTDTPGDKVNVFTRTPGGSFGPATTFDGGLGTLATGPDGSIALTSTPAGESPTTGTRVVRVRRPGGDFSAPTQLPGKGFSGPRSFFLTDDGRLFGLVRLDDESIQLFVRAADGAVTMKKLLDSAPEAGDYEMVPLPGGGARLVIYTLDSKPKGVFDGDTCFLHTRVYGATVHSDGSVTALATLGEGNEDGHWFVGSCGGFNFPAGIVGSPALAVSAKGETFVAYAKRVFPDAGHDSSNIVARTFAPDKDWPDSSEVAILSGVGAPWSAVYAGDSPMLAVATDATLSNFYVTQYVNGEWAFPVTHPNLVYLVGSPDGTGLIVDVKGNGASPPTGQIRALVRNPDGSLGATPKLMDDQGNYIGSWADPNGDLGVAFSRDTDPAPATDSFQTQVAVYDSAPPVVKATAPASATQGQDASFSATAVDAWSSIPDPIAWAFGGGGSGSGSPVSHAFSALGAQTATASASDSFGNTASSTASVDVAAPPADDTKKPGDTAGTGGTAPSFTARPRLTPSTLRAAPRGATLAKKAPTSSRLTFGLSAAATVTLQVERKGTGRRVGRRCVAATRANRRRTKCTRYVAVRGSASKSATAGSNRFTFRARMGGHKLTPGSYRLTLTARDSAKRTSEPARVNFKVAQ
jgi:hypothetical protein